MSKMNPERIRQKFEEDRIRWNRNAEMRKLTGEDQEWHEAQIESRSAFLYAKLLHLKDHELPIQVLRHKLEMKKAADLEQAEQRRVKKQQADDEKQRVEQQRVEQPGVEQQRADDAAELSERKKLLNMLSVKEKQQTEQEKADEPVLSEHDIRRIDKKIDGFRNNVNAQDIDGNTALHLAARGFDFGLSRKLIAAGASRRIINNRDQFPSDLATGYSDLHHFLDMGR